MMHVRYKLGTSETHGIGIFADEDLKKGTVIYTLNPALDVNMGQTDFELLPESEQKEIRYWGYWFEPQKVWHVDFSNIKFINHSFTPNTHQDLSLTGGSLIAIKDIQKGEELTQNYLDFESEEVLRKRGIMVE